MPAIVIVLDRKFVALKKFDLFGLFFKVRISVRAAKTCRAGRSVHCHFVRIKLQRISFRVSHARQLLVLRNFFKFKFSRGFRYDSRKQQAEEQHA